MHYRSLGVSQQWHSSTSKKPGKPTMKNGNIGKITVENGRDAQHLYNGAITQDKKRQEF